MMPEDLSLLDQLEEWIESQIPRDLHDLPYRMLDTMERVSNEIFETLNLRGPDSISIPFPPFGAKELPPPPPPTPAGISALPCTLYNRAHKLVKAHPYVIGTGAGMALTVGLGYGAAQLGYGGRYGRALRNRRKFGTNGVVEDGMLKEAIVILSPSPMPPLLWVLTVTLLKAGYIVLVAVPRVEDAESLEKRMSPLDEKTGLRVLIYDPDDNTSFHPFQRSLLATLTLRFPAHNSEKSNDPYNPSPDHIPHIHAFISLYALNPNPPDMPKALPAIPSLLSSQTSGPKPMFVSLYPSGSVIVQPETFPSQLLTSTHRLLAQNTAMYTSSRVVSVFVGHLNLPPLHQAINGIRLMIYKLSFKEKWRQATASQKILVIKDAVFAGLTSVWSGITGRLGVGAAAKDYKYFERRLLRILKSRHGDHYGVGQYSYLPFMLTNFSPTMLRLVESAIELPGPNGPLHASVQGLPAPRKPLGPSTSASTSTSGAKKSAAATDSAASSDHESGEDLTSSIFSLQSAQSGKTTSSREAESVGSGTGLEDSWAQLDAPQ